MTHPTSHSTRITRPPGHQHWVNTSLNTYTTYPRRRARTTAAAAASTDAADVQIDPVKVEIERWSYLPPETIQSYIASDGIVNHFKLLWELRARFPLHFIVFRTDLARAPLQIAQRRLCDTVGILATRSDLCDLTRL